MNIKFDDVADLDKLMIYFTPPVVVNEKNSGLRNPFDNNPDDYAIKAVNLLQERLMVDDSLKHRFFDAYEGKMFGVLVVADEFGRIGFLSAFSGMLQNQWLVEGFVPPIFDVNKMQGFLKEGELELKRRSTSLLALENNQTRKQIVERIKRIKQQSINRLAALKLRHKENKKHRKAIRERLIFKDNEAVEMAHLSQQSQDDKRAYKALKKSCDESVYVVEEQLKQGFENEIEQLKRQRRELSQYLHRQVFELYQMRSHKGLKKPITSLFDTALPPGGAGDCAAPKLVQYALIHQLTILSLSEFWWGASPKKEIRHHQQFYPPCRSKCHHILPFMFDGLCFEPIREKGQNLLPTIVYEDDDLIVLNKPEGLLSIPGKLENHSVLSWLQNNYADAQGALLVHRLDQATSGIMLAAKKASVHKALQKQFVQRSVKKRYVAVLSTRISQNKLSVNLPLRVDLDDRPRQLVCFEHGKLAETTVELIRHESKRSRVYFYPKTGRTHQLRVHAAHADGLNSPIVGDLLYGLRDKRLMLHAESIEFEHPVLKQQMSFKVDTPF